jgi:nucleoside-diphosphate-sugar epimerase
MTTAVAGGTGEIGSVIARLLASGGEAVRLVRSSAWVAPGDRASSYQRFTGVRPRMTRLNGPGCAQKGTRTEHRAAKPNAFGAVAASARGNIVATLARPYASDASANPRYLDDSDAPVSIFRVCTRLRALWA